MNLTRRQHAALAMKHEGTPLGDRHALKVLIPTVTFEKTRKRPFETQMYDVWVCRQDPNFMIVDTHSVKEAYEVKFKPYVLRYILIDIRDPGHIITRSNKLRLINQQAKLSVLNAW